MSTEPPPPAHYYRPLDGPDGERFHATSATAGPWFADAQHLGPPSALLARAVERLPGQPGAVVSRLTVEVLGPVPTGEVQVGSVVERPGRAVELLAAELTAGGRTVLRARAWRLAGGDTAAVTVGVPEPLPAPDTGTTRDPDMVGWVPGFVDSVEWRFLHGWFADPGPGAAWIRQRVPLVEGERPSPLQRLAVAADCANGVAAPLDVRQWLFVNTDLTVHLHRAPVGEWMGVDATTTVGPTGQGLAAAVLHDEQGPVGRSAQSLVVRPR